MAPSSYCKRILPLNRVGLPSAELICSPGKNNNGKNSLHTQKVGSASYQKKRCLLEDYDGNIYLHALSKIEVVAMAGVAHSSSARHQLATTL
jgi:hypothetical protein